LLLLGLDQPDEEPPKQAVEEDSTPTPKSKKKKSTKVLEEVDEGEEPEENMDIPIQKTPEPQGPSPEELARKAKLRR